MKIRPSFWGKYFLWMETCFCFSQNKKNIFHVNQIHTAKILWKKKQLESLLKWKNLPIVETSWERVETLLPWKFFTANFPSLCFHSSFSSSWEIFLRNSFTIPIEKQLTKTSQRIRWELTKLVSIIKCFVKFAISQINSFCLDFHKCNCLVKYLCSVRLNETSGNNFVYWLDPTRLDQIPSHTNFWSTKEKKVMTIESSKIYRWQEDRQCSYLMIFSSVTF